MASKDTTKGAAAAAAPAPEEAKDKDEGAPERRRRGGRLAAAVAVMALGGGAAGLVAALGVDGAMELAVGGAAEPTTGDQARPGQGAADAHADVPSEVLQMEQMLVNVGSTGPGGRKKSRFMKITVALVHPAGGRAELDRRLPFVKDAFQDFLRQMDESEIEGTAGLMRLRAELLRRARAVAGDGAVREVLISDLLVQ